MNREEAEFAGDLGEKHRRPAWKRFLKAEEHRKYLRRRAMLEEKEPVEFVRRVRNHGWWARDDFRNQCHRYGLTSLEWLINRLVPALIVTWDEFDDEGNLVDEHRGRIRGIAAKRIADGQLPNHDPDDLITYVWPAVVRGLLTFDPGKGDFRHWIAGIADNEARKAARRERPRLQVRYSAADPENEGTIEVMDPGKGPDERIEEEEDRDRLRRWADDLLASLRERDPMAYEIVRLRVAGMEFREMAARLRGRDDEWRRRAGPSSRTPLGSRPTTSGSCRQAPSPVQQDHENDARGRRRDAMIYRHQAPVWVSAVFRDYGPEAWDDGEHAVRRDAEFVVLDPDALAHRSRVAPGARGDRRRPAPGHRRGVPPRYGQGVSGGDPGGDGRPGGALRGAPQRLDLGRPVG